MPYDINSETFYKKAMEVSKQFDNMVPYDVAVGYTWSDTASEISALISNANLLMQASKTDKVSRSDEYFAKRQNEIKNDLLLAIKNNKSCIYLQPKVSVSTGLLCGAEALIRMKGKDDEIIPPNNFIPLLEELGLIRYVDFWVLEKTVECLARWKKQGQKLFPISLNFSRATFLEPTAVEHICSVCEQYSISTKYLEIEITESLGDIETESIMLVAKKYKEKEIRLALDDFGAKYSNISIFGSIPFTTLKMDKTMIDPILFNPKMLDVAETVVSLCHKQSVCVVAEGVEREEQLKKLKEIGCDIVQGYFINKPLPILDFEKIYHKNDFGKPQKNS